MTALRSLCIAAALSSSVLATSIVTAPLAQQPKPPREVDNSVAYLYKAFGASCHGATGTGDGVIKDLFHPDPGDLTLLAARAGGVFPREQV